jgi:hypothetical protein
MPKPRGDVERSQKLARLRHIVQIPIPVGGLGENVSAMHSWALKRCGPGGYLDSGRIEQDREKKPVEFALFHFPDAAAARDFAAAFRQIGAKVV